MTKRTPLLRRSGTGASSKSKSEPEAVPVAPEPFEITGRYFYFDTITFRSRRFLTKAEVRQLRATGVKAVHWNSNRDDRPVRAWGREYVLQQPAPAALRNMAEMFPRATISRVDVAVDLICPDERNREALVRFLERHLVKAHRGKQRRSDYWGAAPTPTRYWAKKAARNNLIVYDDKPCRITGEVDCVHLEWRIRTPRAVRARGLSTFDALTRFDIEGFWRRHLRLREIDGVKLDRILKREGWYKRRQRHASKSGFQYRSRSIANLLLKIANYKSLEHADNRDFGQVQDMIDGWAFKSPRNRRPIAIAKAQKTIANSIILGPGAAR